MPVPAPGRRVQIRLSSADAIRTKFLLPNASLRDPLHSRLCAGTTRIARSLHHQQDPPQAATSILTTDTALWEVSRPLPLPWHHLFLPLLTSGSGILGTATSTRARPSPMSRYKFIRCIKLALDAATVKVYTNKLKKEVLTAQVRADFR